MELNWFSILAAAWLSTWVLSLLRLYLPAMKLMSIHYPQSAAVKFRWAGFFVFSGLAFIFVPVLLPIVLMDNLRERFVKSYIEGVMGLNREDE